MAKPCPTVNITTIVTTASATKPSTLSFANDIRLIAPTLELMVSPLRIMSTPSANRPQNDDARASREYENDSCQDDDLLRPKAESGWAATRPGRGARIEVGDGDR